MKWTKNDIDKLLKDGKIRGFVETQKGCKNIPQKSGKNISGKGSKQKAWIHKNLWAWCIEKGFLLQQEVKFHPSRKWRFDFAIEDLQVAVEYEGLMSEKSRHTTVTGFSGDTEKYNAAQSLGWTVLRYTSLTYKNLITDLDNLNK